LVETTREVVSHILDAEALLRIAGSVS